MITSMVSISSLVSSSNITVTLDLSFDDEIYLKACALDPVYAFNWLQVHPGTDDEKAVLRQRIIG